MSRRPLSHWTLRLKAGVRTRIGTDGESRVLAEAFGLSRGASRTEVLFDGLELTVAPGRVIAVVGPSGAGKSVLLRAAARAARRRARRSRSARPIILDTARLHRCDAPAVAAVGEAAAPLEERLALLSRCGLAEARVLVSPAKLLSGGQLFRLALARAILSARRAAREGRTPLIIADEFASTLDETTAWALCRRLRKLFASPADAAGRPTPALLLATARPHLLEALRPDRVIVKPLGSPARSMPHAPPAPPRRPPDAPRQIRPGSIRDYRALARFHYIAGEPAAHKCVWVVDAPEAVAAPAAVLVVSPPVARCRGRNAALPRRYTAGDRRAALARLNREIECISRVVVHPIYRGLGLGVALVRHALATARAPMVEALAAMGRIHPLFEKAGMYSFGAFAGRRRYVYYLGRRTPYVVRRRATRKRRRRRRARRRA
jgi:ABC-type ATPase with predicted acetyltransferase domain